MSISKEWIAAIKTRDMYEHDSTGWSAGQRALRDRPILLLYIQDLEKRLTLAVKE